MQTVPLQPGRNLEFGVGDISWLNLGPILAKAVLVSKEFREIESNAKHRLNSH